jgi:hypothetical protein
VTKWAPVVALAAALLSCEGALLTAPPGSTMVITANPGFIASHGGVSELTVLVTEPAGTDVPDGTAVLWTTNLGRVDRETRTFRGIARNRLVSDSRSGIATVIAVSGGESILPPSPTPSSSPSPSPSPSPNTFGPAAQAATVGAASSGTALQNSVSVNVTIGNANVATVRLRAVPTRITISNTTHLIATVLDRFGNPVPNVPVFFEVVSNLDFDFLESGGAAVHTDNNGEAEDILKTRRTTAGTITVRAFAAGPGGFIASPIWPVEVL